MILVSLLLGSTQAHALCFATGAFEASTLCWNPVNPAPARFDTEQLVWNPDGQEYLALGIGGAILASPDGSNWTPRNSGTIQNLYGGLWDGARYVVVGDGGLVLTSPDGVTWTPRITNTRLRLLDIAWSGSTYVIVGERGLVLYSQDAVNWSQTTVLSLTRRPVLYGVLWHNDRFVAVGSSTTIISSDNGVDWAEHNYAPLVADEPPPPILRDIAVSNNGVFVAVGGSGAIYRSSNGFDWEAAPPIASHTDARLRAVVRTGGPTPRFLAVGDDGSSDLPLILGSEDGRIWSEVGALPPADDLQTLKTIAYNGTSQIVIGGNRHLFHASPTDLDWIMATTPADLATTINDLGTAPFAAPLHLAVGDEGRLLTSTNGFDWTPANSGTDRRLNAVTARGGDAPRAVAVGEEGTILYSDDGSAWNAANVPGGVQASLTAVAFGDNRFIAVGLAGTVLSSADGADWIVTNIGGLGVDLQGVAFGLVDNSPLFIAVGNSGAVLTSTDGVDWISRPAPVTGTLRAVIWNADEQDPRFVAVGGTAGTLPAATVIHSTNGSNWTAAQDLPTPTPALLDVAWNGRQYLAVSDQGRILRSTTGQGWTTLGSPRENDVVPRLNTAAWTGTHFLTAGAGGAIFNSGGVDLAVDVDADVSVSEDDDPSFGRAGALKVYRFTVSNIGNVDAVNVQFIYTLPPEITQSIGPQLSPANWTCVVFGGGTGLSCNTGRLIAGTEAVTIEISVPLPDEGDQTIVHGLEVPAAAIDDVQPANNVLTVATRVGARTAPGLPSPDTDFSSRGTFGSLDLTSLLLAGLAALALRRFGRRPRHLTA